MSYETALARQSEAVVTPLSIYAARRQSFEAIIRCVSNAAEMREQLFRALPLEEHGWRKDRTRLRVIGTSAYSRHVHVERMDPPQSGSEQT